jgi:hypothetical protein
VATSPEEQSIQELDFYAPVTHFEDIPEESSFQALTQQISDLTTQLGDARQQMQDMNIELNTERTLKPISLNLKRS